MKTACSIVDIALLAGLAIVAGSLARADGFQVSTPTGLSIAARIAERQDFACTLDRMKATS
jgi:hypothetical protein